MVAGRRALCEAKVSPPRSGMGLRVQRRSTPSPLLALTREPLNSFEFGLGWFGA